MGLPAEFLDTMKALLGGEYEEYLQSFERESLQGIRVNTSKIDVDAFLQKKSFSAAKRSLDGKWILL